jgi:hypothetical protein
LIIALLDGAGFAAGGASSADPACWSAYAGVAASAAQIDAASSGADAKEDLNRLIKLPLECVQALLTASAFLEP